MPAWLKRFLIAAARAAVYAAVEAAIAEVNSETKTKKLTDEERLLVEAMAGGIRQRILEKLTGVFDG